MSGRNKVADQIQLQSAQQNQQIAQQQSGIAQSYLDLSKGELARRTQLQQPLVDFNKAITGGNMDAAISAMGVPLGNIARSSKQTTENIFNTIPAGAGRDYALASVERDKGSQSAGALNSAFMQALAGNSALGSEALQAGLQQEGATASSFGGATNANYASGNTAANLSNQAAQRKATTMGFLGSLAGAGGSVARGFLSGGGGGAFAGSTASGEGMSSMPASSYQPNFISRTPEISWNQPMSQYGGYGMQGYAQNYGGSSSRQTTPSGYRIVF